MKIGGFVKQSLIDYPGKIAAVVFTQGCNFRCGYCHNPHLVLPELFQEHPEYTPGTIMDYLKAHNHWLDGVVVSGGEPTIHRDLPQFLKEIKALKLLVKLDTNGSDPVMLKQIIDEQLADYIAMDIKTIPENSRYEGVIGIPCEGQLLGSVLSSIALLNHAGITAEFRTTLIPGEHTAEFPGQIRSLIGHGIPFNANDYRDGPTVFSVKNQ